MYQCCLDHDHGNGYILMRPNLAETWQAAAWFFGLVAVVPLIIALGFAAMGFWPILPFAGLEVVVLIGAVLKVRGAAAQQEVLRFSDDRVALERGVQEAEYEWVRQRAWIRAHYDKAPVYGHPNKLSLGYQNERCEFGRFLTNKEREEIVGVLAKLVRVLRDAN